MKQLYVCCGCKEEKNFIPNILCDKCTEIKMSYGNGGDESTVPYIEEGINFGT